jgi:hypothetical protein
MFTSKSLKIFWFTTFLLTACLLFATVAPVLANSYDGTYDYSYTYKDMDAQTQTMDLGSVFIVSGGEISVEGSSNRFSGSVDDWGGVSFTGPSPEGTLTATFTGTIDSDGSGSGSWTDGINRGNWYVTRTGGGDLDFGSIDPVAAGVALAAGIIVFAVIYGAYKNNVAKRKSGQTQSIAPKGSLKLPHRYPETRPVNPQYSQPPSPSGLQGPGEPVTDGVSVDALGNPLPPPIDMDNGTPIYEGRPMVAPVDMGSLPFLNATWQPGLASLEWQTPQFDSSKYRLVGYDISQQMYGPNSTAPQSINLTRLGPNANNVNITPFNQTYNWSTGGDTAGFRVDPVFQQIGAPGQFHSGGLGVRVGEPFGTFGVGP